MTAGRCDICGKLLFAEDAKALREAAGMLGKSEEVKHGYWLSAGHDAYTHYRRCSVCKRTIGNIPKYSFCPNCGAKMDGGEDNDC